MYALSTPGERPSTKEPVPIRTAFARLTGLGEAALARWERGEVIQKTSNDRFLRLLMNEDILRRPSSLTQHEEELGREFSMIFQSLRNDWASCLMRYKEIRKLFGDAERVKLLNAIGGGLFRDVQQMSWSDLMVRLTRLTDPPKSAGKDNLTLRRLPDHCGEDLREEVSGLVSKAVTAAAFARDWRNRHISHSDLARAIDPSAEPLAPADLRKVKAALDAVHAVLNAICVRLLLDSGIHNDVVVTPRAGAFVAYLRQLVDAVQYIDSVIDPSGDLPVTDLAAATTFLQRLDRRPTWQHQEQVFELREAARRFK